ncbi:YhgE/Pip family protein [Peribacillus sp. SCS-155]|uniref:YhgE/Pip family protein n=1 Tax=Peribacillus sedimenti TaxID=3115297 RepID=UPI003906CBDE
MGTNTFIREIKAIFTNRRLLIPIIAILFIPVMYSGMFLWAFWDPYKHLEKLPVAVVNADTGAEMNGRKLQIGKDFIDNLKESKQFNFKFLNKGQAYKELKNQKYYLVVEIPDDFSKNATTLMDEHPRKLELKYVPNESYNFLSAQIGDNAMQKIKAALSEKVTETYAQSIFENMSKMADGYQTADQGAGKLTSGINEVNKGAESLQENLQLLAKKQIEFSEGTNKVYNGSAQLERGAAQLAAGMGKLTDGQKQILAGAQKTEGGAESLNGGITELQRGLNEAADKTGTIADGTSKLYAGAKDLTGYLNELHSGTQQLAKSTADGAEQAKANMDELKKKLEPVLSSMSGAQKNELLAQLNQFVAQSEALKNQTAMLNSKTGEIAAGSAELQKNISQLADGQKALNNGVHELEQGAGNLEAGSNELVSGQKELSAGIKTFGEKLKKASDGANAVAEGAANLTDGAKQLEGGSKALADGSDKLSKGSEKISAGTSELAKGSTEFKDKIAVAAKETEDVKAGDETYDMMSQPVKVDKESINKVPNYGTGFAPYFISLGLFVGALMVSIVFPLREPAGEPKSGFSWFISKFGVIAGIGMIQALVACAVLILGLGIEVQNVPLFIVFSVVTSLVFLALVQLLVTALGDPGRFIAIIVLILQLTTSAGTFPIELIPEKLQFFHKLLPMTYSVKGYKEVISSGNIGAMWENGYILLGFMAAFLALTLSFFTILHKKRYLRNNEND